MKILLIISSTILFAGLQLCSSTDFKTNLPSIPFQSAVKETKTVKLRITGMTCAGCSNHVAATLTDLDGVIDQQVEYPGDLAVVKYDPAKTSVDKIIKAIEKIGYKAAVISEKAAGKKE